MDDEKTEFNITSEFILDNRYEVIKKLKAGGMGAVYLALDRRFDKTPCAVKEMLSQKSDTEEHQSYLIERFKDEAKILHELRHPNLPVVKDYFYENSRYYLVMDYIDGMDLDTVMRSYSNGVPEAIVIDWAKQILDALDYLHSKEPPIVYRDMKPGNVMLRKSDQKIILVDFGIAREVETNSDTLKTIIGTPAFAPDELFNGKPEPRTDIYSLGATMHCLLSGIIPRTPFAFKPLRELNPCISEDMENIVSRALSRDISQRFLSAGDMKEAIEKINISYSSDSITINPMENIPEATAPLSTAKDSEVTIPVSQVKTSENQEESSVGKIEKYLVRLSMAVVIILFILAITKDYFYVPLPGTIALVSGAQNNVWINNFCWSPCVSSDGNLVVFHSGATNLVRGDINKKDDIFIWNKDKRQINLLSSSSLEQSNGNSRYPSISSDGHLITFESDGTNIIPGMKNKVKNIFICYLNKENQEPEYMELVTKGCNGKESDGPSCFPYISSDGNYIVFESEATNLVKGYKKNRFKNIFLYNVKTGNIDCISRALSGKMSDGNSSGPSISSDGHYIVFSSEAKNLVKNDKNTYQDIFLYDLHKKRLKIISNSFNKKMSDGDSRSPFISPDGKWVVFSSLADNLIEKDKNKKEDVFKYNIATGKLTRITSSEPDGQCWNPYAAGEYVSFYTSASNIDKRLNKGLDHVIIASIDTGKPLVVQQISKKDEHIWRHSSSFSSNGLYFTFPSDMNYKLYDNIFLFNIMDKSSVPMTVMSKCWAPVISSDGLLVAFTSDSPGLTKKIVDFCNNVFIWNMNNKLNNCISISSDEEAGNGDSLCPSISGNGQKVAFQSDASNFIKNDKNNCTDIFVHFIEKPEKTECISLTPDGKSGNGPSFLPSISVDGNYVAFISCATDLISGDSNDKQDIFLWDCNKKRNVIISISSDSTQGNGKSFAPYVSCNGEKIVFLSEATNLLPGDNNGKKDVFLREVDKKDRRKGFTSLVSISNNGEPANDDSAYPFISSNGSYIAFSSKASNLVPDDKNGKSDIFICEAGKKRLKRVSISFDGKEGNGDSEKPSVSDDGRYVVFASYSDNLVPNDKNKKKDVFLHDMRTGNTIRLSVSSDGIEGNGDSEDGMISLSGTFVTFSSYSTNFTSDKLFCDENIYLRELDRGLIFLKH